MATIFTKIMNGEIPGHIVWQDESCVAFLTIKPISPGHVLLVPRQEINNIFDLPDALYQHLWAACKPLSAAIQTCTGCKRVGIAVEGFEIPHAHIHLVPINGGNELDPHRAKDASQEELKAMCEKIKAALA